MRSLILVFVLIVSFSCSQEGNQLPILGMPDIIGEDTIYPTVPNFEFTNQLNQSVTNQTFHNKIYVADFIFLTCPSICPKMTSELQKVYQNYQNNEHVLFLSHTIDPKNDSVPILLNYANSLKVNHQKWHFVTGKEYKIHDIAENGYYAAAYKDSLAPGGFAHSGGLLLIDKYKHIRGVYDGTSDKETKKLIKDIALLIEEQF
jgi:protein SCO1/2